MLAKKRDPLLAELSIKMRLIIFEGQQHFQQTQGLEQWLLSITLAMVPPRQETSWRLSSVSTAETSRR